MKYIRVICMFSIMLFSFYFSDKALLYVESLSPIMKEIETKEEVSVEAVNAIIDGNTIIPGISSSVLNKRESYLKMNDFGKFNENFLIYDKIRPEISLIDNKDKIIISGNRDDIVYIIIDSNKFEEYLINEGIYYNKLILTKEKENEYVTFINSNYDLKGFINLSSYFKRSDIKERICLVGKSNINICRKKENYIVKENLDIYQNNLIDITNVSGGDIIYIHDDVNLSSFKYIISHIKYRNLKIRSLMDLIEE